MTEFVLISSLEKVMPMTFEPGAEFTEASALLGERVSFQIVYKSKKAWTAYDYKIKVNSKLSDFVTLRSVETVPVDLPCQKDEFDDDYITTEPALIPDVLAANKTATIESIPAMWRSLWVTVEPDDSVNAGVYPIDIVFECPDETVTKTFKIKYINAKLPEQELKFTQWFHGDCIASYYGIETFSEEHWKRLEDFIRAAVHGGINTILTPVVTPPLDTAVGGERPTIQLVDMTYIGGKWSFNFDKLDRFVALAHKCGIKYFEIAHLFTQWGAKFTPKVMATTEKGYERVFGWDVASDSAEYTEYINAFLPALVAHFKELGIDKDCFYHISDEPTAEHFESYSKCKELVKSHLEGYRIMDALSDYDFYAKGVVEKPVVATDHVKKYLDNKVSDLWVYYCSAQARGVSNRFIAMPSYRNRVIGTQLYKYDIAGFLQWGFNFYYSRQSKYLIDPYRNTSAAGSFPCGDSFSVYPTKDGVDEAIGLVVFYEALQDLRAFKLLESLKGKDYVMDIIEGMAGMEIEFDKYPKSADYILNLRKRINEEIEKAI